MTNVISFKGKPVLVMRRGLYPNKNDIKDIMASWPGHSVHVEMLRFAETDTTSPFVVTVRKYH